MDEFTREFFTKVHRDPVTHMMVSIHADAWADGYEQALRDLYERVSRGEDAQATIIEVREKNTHSDLRNRAAEDLTEERRRYEAEALLAFAHIAPHHPPPWPPP